MTMSLAVVIPAHNAASTLPACLSALAASDRSPEAVVVVDDGSTDTTAELARAAGVEVLSTGDRPVGAAAARNLGVQRTRGDVVVFVDADVAVHPDALRRFAERLAESPGIDAVFGSYDAQPPCRTAVSLYANLRHHYTHQKASPRAWTFWSGLGAMRRTTFESLGGFDERWGTDAEDIELGMRLWSRGGDIRLDRQILATHHKRWTLASLIRADIKSRAIPWTRLLLRIPDVPRDLNLGWSARLSAGLVAMMPLLAFAGFWRPWCWAGLPAAVLGVVGLNAGLYRCFWRHGGAGTAAAALLLHPMHLGYSAVIFGSMSLYDRLTGRVSQASTADLHESESAAKRLP